MGLLEYVETTFALCVFSGGPHYRPNMLFEAVGAELGNDVAAPNGFSI